jgi:hypothetical protein
MAASCPHCAALNHSLHCGPQNSLAPPPAYPTPLSLPHPPAILRCRHRLRVPAALQCTPSHLSLMLPCNAHRRSRTMPPLAAPQSPLSLLMSCSVGVVPPLSYSLHHLPRSLLSCSKASNRRVSQTQTRVGIVAICTRWWVWGGYGVPNPAKRLAKR